MRKTFLLSAVIASFSLLSSCTKDPVNNRVPIANAGSFQQIAFPEKAQLSGSGSDEDGIILGYLWSQLSGPAESTLLNPADSTTTITFPTYGTYKYQLMVVDNDGATGLDTVSVLVTKPPTDSITFTSSDHGYMDLTFAGNSFRNYTDPTTAELAMASWTLNGGDDELRAALQFDFATLPANPVVVSAKLSLYSNPTPINGNQVDANYGSSNAFYIRRITGDWDLNSGWFSQPATTTDGQIYIPQTDSSRLNLIDIDVTSMVQGMITNGNHGFFLQLASEIQYNSRIFCNSRYPDATKRPVLKIVFQN